MRPTSFLVNKSVIGIKESGLLQKINQYTSSESKIYYSRLDKEGKVDIPGYKPDGRTVVVIGGDGTISSNFDYVQRAYEADSSKPPNMLPIACGTGNGINVALDLKLSGFELLERYASDKLIPRSIDLIEMQDNSRARYVLNIFDAGLVPLVLEQRNELLLKNPEFFNTHSKVYRQEIAYGLASLIAIAKGYNYEFSRIELDGKPQDTENVKLLTLGNGLSYSSKPGIYPLPVALIDDGLISTASHKIPSFGIPRWWVSLTTGITMLLHIKNPYAAKYSEAEEVLIEGHQIPCQLDGEYIGRKNSIELRIHKASEGKGLNILVPN